MISDFVFRLRPRNSKTACNVIRNWPIIVYDIISCSARKLKETNEYFCPEIWSLFRIIPIHYSGFQNKEVKDNAFFVQKR